MFEEQFNINQFSGTLPIFPLPNVVFFPKTVLPLHIFEMRYRQMLSDAVAGEKLIGMALLKPGWEKDYHGSPKVHKIACMGKITEFQKLDDGRWNIILLGLKKVKIREFVKEEPYRVAQVKIVKETCSDEFDSNVKKKKDLIDLFLKFVAKSTGKAIELGDLDASISFKVLVNSISSALEIDVYEKQVLLEFDDLQARYNRLKDIMTKKVEFGAVLDRFRAQMPRDAKLN